MPRAVTWGLAGVAPSHTHCSPPPGPPGSSEADGQVGAAQVQGSLKPHRRLRRLVAGAQGQAREPDAEVERGYGLWVAQGWKRSLALGHCPGLWKAWRRAACPAPRGGVCTWGSALLTPEPRGAVPLQMRLLVQAGGGRCVGQESTAQGSILPLVGTGDNCWGRTGGCGWGWMAT